MSQFHESFNLILGGLFRPSKWRRGTTESRFQQHSVFRGQHRERTPGARNRHQPWGWRPWQKKTCPWILHGGRFNVWIHDQWWQKLNDIWTNWFVNKTKNSSKSSVTWTVVVIWQVFFCYRRKGRFKVWIHNQWHLNRLICKNDKDSVFIFPTHIKNDDSFEKRY